MKIIIYILFFFTSIRISKCEKLQIKIYNKTGFDIQYLRLSDVYMGDIKKDSILILSNWKEIKFQGKVPFGKIKGYIKGLKEDESNHIICGTGVSAVNNGKYEFDLVIYFYKFGYLLYFSPH
jgi:hypothetical protein